MDRLVEVSTDRQIQDFKPSHAYIQTLKAQRYGE
jgi:hypothetical protein